jgi:hypothetical protein
MSFVNLMASDVWSEVDIINRTESMIAGHSTPQAVAILQRKVTAEQLGQYKLTDAEKAELQAYQLACFQAQQAGIEARADMVLLTEVLAVEAGTLQLESASEQAQLLRAIRNPVPEDSRSAGGGDAVTGDAAGEAGEGGDAPVPV